MIHLSALTMEQKEYAAEHHNLVYRFLRLNRLDESEFYDVVIFGYLKAVREYLEKPELSRFKFSTIAWRKMKDCVIQEYIYQNRSKRRANMAEYHEDLESNSLDTFLPDRMSMIAETMDNQTLLVNLLALLSPKEKTIVHLKAQGYTYREIAKLCSMTPYVVNHCFYNMRKRLREIELI